MRVRDSGSSPSAVTRFIQIAKVSGKSARRREMPMVAVGGRPTFRAKPAPQAHPRDISPKRAAIMIGNSGQTARGVSDSLMSVILGIDQSAASRCRSELHAGTTQLRTRLGRGEIGNGARNARAVPPLKVGQQPRAGRRPSRLFQVAASPCATFNPHDRCGDEQQDRDHRQEFPRKQMCRECGDKRENYCERPPFGMPNGNEDRPRRCNQTDRDKKAS